MLEGILDAEALGGGTSLNDVVEALDKSDNLLESGTGVLAGRTLGRFLQGSGRGGKVHIDPEQYAVRGDNVRTARETAERDVAASIEESAQALEDLNRLTDKNFYINRGTASGSELEELVQGARENRLTAKNATKLEIKYNRNREAMADAIENIHNNRRATDPSSYNPRTTLREIDEAVQARGSVLEDIEWATTHNRMPQADGTVHATEQHTFFFRKGSGEGPADPNKPSSFDMSSGLVVEVNHTTREVVIPSLANDEKVPGGAPFLLAEALEKIEIPPNYVVGSGDVVSPNTLQLAQRLEDAGWGLRLADQDNLIPITDARGKGLETADGGNVFTITHIPGKYHYNPLPDYAEPYSRSALTEQLDDTLGLLAAQGENVSATNSRLQATLGWNPDRQKGIYSVANSRGSRLNRTLSQIEARLREAPTGVQEREANALLRSALKTQSDEEGYEILAGLNDEALDYANLLRARDSIEAVANRTKDPMTARLVEDIEYALSNGKIVQSSSREPVDAATDQAIRTARRNAQEAQMAYEYLESKVTTNALFKKNALGEYQNIELKELGNVLRNGSKYYQHIKPFLRSNPSANQTFQSAISDLYKDQVLSGTGFTKGKHDTFMRNYSTALEELFPPDVLAAARNVNFDPKTGNNFLLSRMEEVKRLYNPLATMGTIEPTNIVGSLSRMENPALYLRKLTKLNPRLAGQLREDAIEQGRRNLQERFFNPENSGNPMKRAQALDSYIADNKAALVALHGDQYVTDLSAVARTYRLDARRLTAGAMKAEDQPDVIRTSRTILGPLSRLQRRITAGNWIRLRLTAKQAMDVYSDPAKLRQLQAMRGVPARSRPGVAAMVRIGLLTGTGWDGVGTMPDDAYQKGIEFLDWLYEVELEREEGSRPEPELEGRTPHGKDVVEAAKRPAYPIHIGGVPMQQYIEEARKARAP